MKKLRKKKRNEAVTSGSMPAVQREAFREAGQIIGQSGDVREGRIFDVVLISEGLGNRRQLNYYGPEALRSAPQAFEGKPCFLNHPSESEDRDIPERRVQDKCGYFKNIRITNLNDGRLAAVGELHTDLSATGKMAADKMLTALHYTEEFPEADMEYVGLSVNADGETEKRVVTWEGERLEANYVLKFTEAESVDLVTKPARGGKVLSLVESERGAIEAKGEVRKMIIETLKKACAKLAEAERSGDVKLLTESREALDELLKKSKKAAQEAEAKLKGMRADEEEDEAEDEAEKEEMYASEDEDEAEAGSELSGARAIPGKGGHADDDASAGDEEEESEDEHDDDSASGGLSQQDPKPMLKKKVMHYGSADDDAKEAKRIAVRHMIREAGLSSKYFDLNKLVKGRLSEARAEVARLKALKEAMAKDIVNTLDYPSSHIAKVTESGRTGNQDLFSGCVR